MGIFAKLFGRKDDDKKVGGMEDYMTLVRVYFQAALASQLGITNLAMLPDLRVFKTSLHVPTVNNRLGIGEKAQVKKMMKNIYDTDDAFFKEIDSSIRKNCHKLQDVNVYRHLLHTVFHGFRQTIFHLIVFYSFHLHHPQFIFSDSLEYFRRPFAHVPDFIYHILIEFRFVTDQKDAPSVFLQGFFQRILCIHIQVVGRLIQE